MSPTTYNGSSYGKRDPKDKVALVEALLPDVFQWARAAGATQPLTSGVWQGDWSSPEKLSKMAKIQLDNSDVTSFHNYDGPAEFEKRIEWLKQYNRPILCTEYMARGNGSTFQGTLPSRRSIKWRHTTGAWLPARRRPTYRGIRGHTLTPTGSRPCGFMKCSGPMARRTKSRKWNSFAR